MSSRAGETTVYTTCLANCGNTSQCVLKAHVRDGVVVAVEPDDRYNAGVGREDAVLSEEDILKVRLQRRPCTKGLVFHKHLYHPERLLYPLRLAPGAKRGEGKFVRISWDEALDTIAAKMRESREKHGPYSIIVPFYSPGNIGLARLFNLWGAGVQGWGWSSNDTIKMMAHIMAGAPGWEYYGYASSSASDMLANSKLIVLWGIDPAMGSFGPGFQFAWFIKLAREKGVPVIIIDPRYTPSAEVLADQWIPIKPGTDTAMLMAMTYVILTENLWDREFVARHVEPEGFEKWRRHILGTDDGMPKTPEWAETKCAVPAATIRELARMVASRRPAWLYCHWGVSRKSRGEQTVRAFVALQAMLGYWGTPGAGPAFRPGPARGIPASVPLGEPSKYSVPRMFRAHYWAQAVLLLDKVKSGELSAGDYMRIVGWRADPSLFKDFNPRVMFHDGNKPHTNNLLVTATDTPNAQIEALQRMDFVVSMHSVMTPTVRYSDIILPARDWMWEEKGVTLSGYGGFECVNYLPGVVKPPGEVRSMVWFHTKLAERLGIPPGRYFSYYTTDENFERDHDRYVRDCYQSVADYYKKQNIAVPSWEEFTSGKFINCEEFDEKPYTGFDDQIKRGKPFKTRSGKIEFNSPYMADEANRGRGEHYDPFGRIYENLPSDWGDVGPIATYQVAVRGMDDERAKDYPLMMLSPHCRYRVHYLFWDHPWLRGNVYRHRVWISPADAQARGIKDDDPVRVFNDRGTAVLPAYVTSRIMPGVVAIHHGAWYTPDDSGTDFGASPSIVLGGDFESGTTPAKTTTLVQIEKYEGEVP